MAQTAKIVLVADEQGEVKVKAEVPDAVTACRMLYSALGQMLTHAFGDQAGTLAAQAALLQPRNGR